MSPRQDRPALLQLCDTSHWRSVVGLTLNLKQSITTESGGFIRLDELSAKLGYGHGGIAVNVDEGWIAYIAKRRGKSGLEDYYDCIDTEAFHNPLDC